MFIRLKSTSTGKEINLMAASIISFIPSDDGKDSIISLRDGTRTSVEESCLSIRNALKKMGRTAHAGYPQETAATAD